VAHGNDGGGSTRIPAACCGLVGLKPQRGRISQAPEAGGLFLVQDGVLTRTVGETAQLLDILAGYEPGDSFWAPEPDADFATQAAQEPGRLRIAVTTEMPLENATLDPVCERATRDAADLLRSLGHEVVEADPPWKVPGLLHLFTALFGPAVTTQIAWAQVISGREATEADMEPLSWAMWQACKGIDSTSALLAQLQLERFNRDLAAWAADYDAVLTPALAEAPVTIGTIDSCAEDPMGAFARSGRFTPYTAVSNVSGSPAISVPLYQRPDDDPAAGMPLGVQLIGRPAGEGPLLALAAQLEAASPWADRRPPVS